MHGLSDCTWYLKYTGTVALMRHFILSWCKISLRSITAFLLRKRCSLLPSEKLINLSLSIGLISPGLSSNDHPYMTSIKGNTVPTLQNTSYSIRTIVYTLAAITLAIIALFIPSLLRGRSIRPQLITGLGRYSSTPEITMSDVKLTPREVKEWNS